MPMSVYGRSSAESTIEWVPLSTALCALNKPHGLKLQAFKPETKGCVVGGASERLDNRATTSVRCQSCQKRSKLNISMRGGSIEFSPFLRVRVKMPGPGEKQPPHCA